MGGRRPVANKPHQSSSATRCTLHTVFSCAFDAMKIQMHANELEWKNDDNLVDGRRDPDDEYKCRILSPPATNEAEQNWN